MISATLLYRLLQKLDVSCATNEIIFACDKATASLPADVQPVEFARVMLTHAQVKDVQPIQLGWRRFDLRRLPALIRHGDTWYLAERLDSENIGLTDEAGANLALRESDLQDALVLWFRPSAQRSRTDRPSLKGNRAAKLVWNELVREPGWIGNVLVATLIVNLIAVATSLFSMQVYDRVVPTFAYATLTTLVVGMGMVILLDAGIKTLRARILDSVSISIDKRVSQQVFDHLLHLRLDIQPKRLGTLAAQVGGLESVRQFFSAGVVFALIDLPFAIFFITVIAVIGGNVAWVYAFLFPVALLLGLVTQFRLRDLLKNQIQRQNERQGVLVDAIRGAESIRAGNATWRFSEEWQSITASIDSYNIQQKAINNFSTVITGSLSSLANVAAVVVGVWQIEAGLMTMGAMVACSILGGRVIAPIAQVVQYVTQWQSVTQSLSMVDQVLSLDLERRIDQSLLLPEAAPQRLELEKVKFTYPDSPVQQVNVGQLKFRSGDRALLIGPVGCGKSTLLKVMAGLYPPSEGRVRLDDADLWEIDPQMVASHVGYLPQSVHLFKGTLKSNLALSGTASDSRVIKITKDLGVDAIATTSSLGMDLPISEGGEGLSGGQRQLVALARVVINQPRIWLLDEPTASIDTDSEARVWQVLADNVRPDDILVVATHRPLQALKFANRVIVMWQSDVIKDGPPESVLPQLMARSAGLTSANGNGGSSASQTGGPQNVV